MTSKVYLKNGMRVLGVECEKCGHETIVGDTAIREAQIGKVTEVSEMPGVGKAVNPFSERTQTATAEEVQGLKDEIIYLREQLLPFQLAAKAPAVTESPRMSVLRDALVLNDRYRQALEFYAKGRGHYSHPDNAVCNYTWDSGAKAREALSDTTRPATEGEKS